MFFQKLSEDAKSPVIKTEGSAAYDLFSLCDGVVEARSRKLVKTGIAMKIPNGFCGLIQSRSGLSLKFGIEKGAGVIDSDYSGDIGVVLYNHSDKPFEFEKHHRVAQLMVVPVLTPKLVECSNIQEKFESHGRGDKGFGSTGVV